MTRHPYESPDEWHDAVLSAVARGIRFAGLYSTANGPAARLIALLATPDGFDTIEVPVTTDPMGRREYPSLSPQLPPAFWYERALHDLSGLTPVGHPRPDPLLLPLSPGSAHPEPGSDGDGARVTARTDTQGPVDVTGHGLFTLTFGPVRSGVFESIEFLLETPGEDIPHLNIRPHFKHRGVAKRFEGRTPDDGVLVAERVEGIASVAHALAFSHATEAAAGILVPPRAQHLRVVLAELERIANHLDVAMRLTDAAGLAVATARFGWHKEITMRIMSRLTGSRFGRTAVIPGGVRLGLTAPDEDTLAELKTLERRIRDDARRTMGTPSFLDRLRGTGPLDADYAAAWALLGPIGRASGQSVDDRWHHPYDGYRHLSLPSSPAVDEDGDARARLRVRWAEIEVSFQLIHAATAAFGMQSEQRLVADEPARPADGLSIGAAEAPQGEVLYAVSFQNGLIARCFARSASLHNLVAFHDAFRTDIFTDFPFIEASFGLSYAGVAM
ncbi:NADH-quinone oxidoreductase subunit C [Gryllotalpicola reticulitermitis]|uniref:NADH-quinone oxidoreductase subunit C n=1 Tax=Gryllotalpicola reticulitermitis TaxID=1184153 RepID=A0ABV8Q695_9MICO